mgnify:FL=1
MEKFTTRGNQTNFEIYILYTNYKEKKLKLSVITVDEPVLDEYDSNIVNYIAGSVCRKIAISADCANCTHCFNFLVKRGDTICKFTKFKEKYSLFIPDKDILSLCKTCETEIRIAKIQESFFKPNLMDTVVQKSINNFCLKQPAFFQQLDVNNHDVSHRYLLLKKIAVQYFKLRMHRESKVHNIDKKIPKIRHKLHKLVHQKHQ